METTSRATRAEISLAAIAHNIRQIKEQVAPARVMAVVKANGYGHGAVATARIALENGAEYLAVARTEEAVLLRQNKLQAPILVFGGFFDPAFEDFGNHDLDVTIFDFSRAKSLSNFGRKINKKIRVHLKVDTGMGRLGVDWRQAKALAAQIVELSGIEFIGIFTHFASSDARDKTFAREQLFRFNSVIDELEQMKIDVPLKHAANSGAILDLPESRFDLVRAGVVMYGYYPGPGTTESLDLMPAMTLKSNIIAIKNIEKGGYVSYGLAYQADRNIRIAVIPIGYGDGYNRRLSNNADVLVHGKRCPVIGRVCMDQLLVEINDGNSVAVGDEVVLIGKQGTEEISIYEICDKLETIPYELTCWISSRVPRIYTN